MDDLQARVAEALKGRYEIVREIGRGGMAVVFLAHDPKYGREVAVKVLLPNVAEAMGAARFLREVRITATLNHPGILPVLDSGEANGLLYYVMPHVIRGSLRSLLNQEKQLALEDVVRLASEVAAALEAAHERNVIHRDIKPENILMHEGRPMLADFGIATAADIAATTSSTDAEPVFGTVAYMSPERCTGDSRGEKRSDIYALGCVVYEMLTGETPFIARNTTALVARIVSEPPRSIRIVRPAIPKKVEQVVLRSLAKVPADRQRTARKFAEDLARAGPGPTPSTIRRAVTVAAILAVLSIGTRLVVGGVGDSGDDDWFPVAEMAVRFTADRTAGEYGWLAEALATIVTAELNDVEALAVRSDKALAAFPVDRIPLDSVGRLLGVGSIVDGSVGAAADSVHVLIRLTDTHESRLLGSVVRVSAPRADEVQIIDKIEVGLSSRLRQVIGGQLQLDQWREQTAINRAFSSLWQANQLIHRSRVCRDSNTEIAHLMLTEARSLLLESKIADRTWSEPDLLLGGVEYERVRIAEVEERQRQDTTAVFAWIARGIEYADTVISANPNHAKALELRGQLRLRAWLWSSRPLRSITLDDARQDLEVAVRLNPNLAGAWLALSTVYQHFGDFEQATRLTERAISTDAWHEEIVWAKRRQLFDALRAGNITQARTLCGFGRRYYPLDPMFIHCPLDVLGWSGNDPDLVDSAWALVTEIDAFQDMGDIASRYHYRRVMVAAVAARAGLEDSARAILARTRNLASTPRYWYFEQAYIEHLLGNVSNALQSLELFIESEPGRREYVREHPWFRDLRAHPGFIAMTAAPPRL